MNEKRMQLLFKHWLQHNWKRTSAIELKICKIKRFNLKKIEKHQLRALRIAKHGLLYYKISDADFITQKPFDCFTLYHSSAYIALMFYTPHKPKIVSIIDIDTILDLIEQGIKSITEDEAKDYSIILATLKG